MKRAIGTAFAAFLLVVFASVSLWAQATAQISGTVKDQSGAVLPGVEITATQTDTGVARTTVTNETGSYVLPSLPTGPYAEAGCRVALCADRYCLAGDRIRSSTLLEVGQVTEQVKFRLMRLIETRSAESAPLETPQNCR
jgi:hypothetical protein